MIEWLKRALHLTPSLAMPEPLEEMEVIGRRKELIVDASINAAMVQIHARDLIRETTAQRERARRLSERLNLLDEVLNNVERQRDRNE